MNPLNHAFRSFLEHVPTEDFDRLLQLPWRPLDNQCNMIYDNNLDGQSHRYNKRRPRTARCSQDHTSKCYVKVDENQHRSSDEKKPIVQRGYRSDEEQYRTRSPFKKEKMFADQRQRNVHQGNGKLSDYPQTLICFKCRQMGHKKIDCPQKLRVDIDPKNSAKTTTYFKDIELKNNTIDTMCFKCGQMGHKKIDCPRKLREESNQRKVLKLRRARRHMSEY